MSNKVIIDTHQNEFTDEIEDIFTNSTAGVNVRDAKIIVKKGSKTGYGLIEVKGSKQVNINAFNDRLSNHYVANVSFLGKEHADLQICPD